MSRTCESCGKQPKKAASRSHSNIKTLRRQLVNLQLINGMRICSSCRRTKVKRAMASGK